MDLYSLPGYQEELERVYQSVPKLRDISEKCVLVTGAGGLIGSFLVDLFIWCAQNKFPCKICGTGRNIDKLRERFASCPRHVELELSEYALGQPIRWEREFSAPPDFIIHCAGSGSPAEFMKNPAKMVRDAVDGAVDILEFAKALGGVTCLFLSSGEVYGNARPGMEAFPETYSGEQDFLSPRSSYPVAKRAVENIWLAYGQSTALKTLIARPCHIYGPTAKTDESRIAGLCMKAALRGENVTLKSRGEQRRSWCYAADCAGGLLTALLKGRSGEVYNIAPGDTATIAELAGITAELAGKKVIFQLPDHMERAIFNPMDHSVLSGEKLRALGWRENYTLKQGLERTYKIMKRMEPFVSVIIPIYNVEEYLDRCLESVCGQSYRNLEIILINDGSTDHSLARALRWKERDCRIKLMNQANQGLGPARMRGVAEANGEYLVFVDSDDWVHADFVKLLVEKAVAENADLVYCDYSKAWAKGAGDYDIGTVQLPAMSEKGSSAEETPQILNQCGVITCNKLYAKRLWKELDLKQPANAIEDICTIFVLLIKAKKIAQVREALYYYFQRESGLSFSDNIPKFYINALLVAKENIAQYGIDAKYKPYIEKIFGEILTFIRLHFGERQELAVQLDEMQKCYIEAFGGARGMDSLIFGSFSLRSMVKEAFYNLPEYFGFSSLICAMAPPVVPGRPKHENALRLNSLKKENGGLYMEHLKKDAAKIQFLFFDFLEERHDVLELQGGGCLTRSDAFEEAACGEIEVKKVIRSGSREFIELWAKSCQKMREILDGGGFSGRIVLVKNRLSERYGTAGDLKEFADQKKIRETNALIDELETIFERCFPDRRVVDVRDSENYFTYKNFTYGCKPWHLNAELYAAAADKISAVAEENS